MDSNLKKSRMDVSQGSWARLTSQFSAEDNFVKLILFVHLVSKGCCVFFKITLHTLGLLVHELHRDFLVSVSHLFVKGLCYRCKLLLLLFSGLQGLNPSYQSCVVSTLIVRLILLVPVHTLECYTNLVDFKFFNERKAREDTKHSSQVRWNER